MGISIVVHGELVHDEDEEFVDDSTDVLQKEFSGTALVKRLSRFVKALEKQKIGDFEMFTEEGFVDVLDHGGDLDHDDTLLLAEELEVIMENFADIEFTSKEDHDVIEIFIDELNDVLVAATEAEGSLEVLNFEETDSDDDEDDDEEAVEDTPEEDDGDDDAVDELMMDDGDEDFDESQFGEANFDDVEGERGEAENLFSKILEGAFEALEAEEQAEKEKPQKED